MGGEGKSSHRGFSPNLVTKLMQNFNFANRGEIWQSGLDFRIGASSLPLAKHHIQGNFL